MTKVYFIGAGPGDPELLSVKAHRLLNEADVIVYAGSLINPEILKDRKAEIYDSSGMSLDEIIKIINDSVKNNQKIVRLHTGDTAFYSAISEQIGRLKAIGIEYKIIPGISSVGAAAAAIGQELTIPEISQTVICTRIEGKTPVPETERLRELSKHRATMVIFLSIGMIEKVREELLYGYPEDTEVAVVEKASWPVEKILRGTLKNIVEIVNEAGIKKTALIIIGDALRASREPTGKESKLYNKNFSHGYRK